MKWSPREDEGTAFSHESPAFGREHHWARATERVGAEERHPPISPPVPKDNVWLSFVLPYILQEEPNTCCTIPYPLIEAGWKLLTKDWSQEQHHLLASTKDSWETDIPSSTFILLKVVVELTNQSVGIDTLCVDADCARPEPRHTFVLAERWTLWSDNYATLLVGHSLPWNIVCLKRSSSQL